MNRSFVLTLSLLLISSIYSVAQNIPPDSLYLGQIPPGDTPKIFHLPVSPGCFPAERIAITTDNREIYFTGIHSYYPTAGDTIKFFKYTEGGWAGPFNLFNGYLAPGLSVNGDTMYVQNNTIPYQTLYSVRNDTNWSSPKRFLYGLNSAHYLQETNMLNHYISSVSTPTLGASDWCKVNINETDTSAVTLGLPVNTTGDNLDFYISRDETFIITTNPQPIGMSISYHKSDGNWTNPKSLGSKINFGLAMWGPYVSADNKYLFYTTGTKIDYSDTYIYWVRIDSLFENLRHTNSVPYLKSKIENQTDSVGYDYNYTFPDTTFIDDDGNNTLTYTATLSNGNSLPSWLSFDASTRTLYGTPTSIGNYFVKITATDTANAKAFCIFNLKIENSLTSVEDDEHNLNDYKLLQNYPNPFNPSTIIEFYLPKSEYVTLRIYDVLGREVKDLYSGNLNRGNYKFDFDAGNISSGIYFYIIETNSFSDQKKMVVIK